jgi:carbamoyltransferase
MADKLARGEPVYLLGITPFGHNSGVALVRASAREGLELVANNEEERFSGVKHCADFPAHSIDALLSQMRELGLGLDHIHAALASWDHVSLTAHGFRFMADELPASLSWLRRDAQDPAMTVEMVTRSMFDAASRLGQQLGMKQPFPVIGM